MFIVQERYLAACLEAGFAKPMLSRQRVAVASRADEFKLLEKPWQGILLLALHEVAPPSDDEEDDAGSTMRLPKQNRARRGRRMPRSSASPLDNLPTTEEVLENETLSPGFAFAVLTARKTLESEDWDEVNNAHLDRLRDRCMAEGVHPVWHDVARRTTVLAVVNAFPEGEDVVVEVDLSGFDLSLGAISGEDAPELLQLLSSASSFVQDPAQKVALATVLAQVESKRAPVLDEALIALEGPLSVVPIVLAHVLDQAVPEAPMAQLAGLDADLAGAHADFASLRHGTVTDWSKSLESSEATSLGRARRRLAWKHAPSEAADRPASVIHEGLLMLQDRAGTAAEIERLRWWHLSALIREGAKDDAVASLSGLHVEADADVEAIVDLVLEIGEAEALQWLEDLLPSLQVDGLVHLVHRDALPSALRLKAVERMQDEAPGMLHDHLEHVVPLLLERLALSRLSRMMCEDGVADAHPWEAVLCAHLLPASRNIDLYHAIRAHRSRLVPVLNEASPPAWFSETTPELIRLLEGGSVASDLFPGSPKAALLAFGQIRNALSTDGNGLVEEKVIEDFQSACDALELPQLDAALVAVLLSTLRLNAAILALQNGTANDATTIALDALVAQPEVPTRFVHAVRQLLFDHDVPLPSLVAWYQEHDPTSPWSIVARAAVASTQGQHLRAAQEYGRAAKAGRDREVIEDNELAFDFEHRVALNRKSLIHFAFAGEWKRAIDLLEDESSLKTAMTERFQLYLHVSHHASIGETDVATQIIQQAVKEREVTIEEDDEGNAIERTRTWFNEDVLDLLMAYPKSHPIALPDEPFIGRVRAARNLTAKRSRHRRNTDQKYATLMDASPTPEEVYELASKVAEEQALAGLMYLERALGSNRFRLLQQKQLQRSMHSLFTMKRDDIPVRDRRHLRHIPLPPLVLVDTNVLVDAMLDLLIRRSGKQLGGGLAIDASRDLHHHLERLGKEGKVRLMIPEVVRHELHSIAKGADVLQRRLEEMLATPMDLAALLEQSNVEEAEKVVLETFDTWTANEPRYEADARDDGRREDLEAFLAAHLEIYEEVTAMKKMRSPGSAKNRTMLNGHALYPESEDLDIMCLAMHLASLPLQDLGAVVVASRDGDFSLVGPSLVEHLGFGAVRSARQLNEWVRD